MIQSGIGLFLLKKAGAYALRKGELRPTPEVVDFIYGNGDGVLNGEDVLDAGEKVLETTSDVSEIVTDIFTFFFS